MLIANSKKQSLSEHLFAVGLLAKEIAKSKGAPTVVQSCAFIAGLLHDIGKIDPNFQKWLRKAKMISKRHPQSCHWCVGIRNWLFPS